MSATSHELSQGNYQPTFRIRLYALLLGTTCHLIFFMAVSLMAYSIFDGLDHPILDLHWRHPIFWDLLLVLQFPLLHSFLLSKPGGRMLDLVSFSPKRSDLRTTIFALISSVQLLIVFACWMPTHVIIWSPPALIVSLSIVIYVLAWVLLAKSMAEAGISIQSGQLGWWSVFSKKVLRYPTFPKSGLHSMSRHPIYFSFALILWTSPSWTLDRLMLAVLWTIYCVAAPKLKEQRYQKIYGESYAAYAKKTSYWWPIPQKRTIPGL